MSLCAKCLHVSASLMMFECLQVMAVLLGIIFVPSYNGRWLQSELFYVDKIAMAILKFKVHGDLLILAAILSKRLGIG